MATFGFTNMVDLAAERMGGKALLCSDDFFAEKENLLRPGRGEYQADKYTDHGKWMDGWETRRRRDKGNDWCIIQLAAPATIFGVDIDTNHFNGNHPESASVEAFNIKDATSDDFEQLPWVEIVPRSGLVPDAQNLFKSVDPGVYTHVRLQIYPDGGIARLRVFGQVCRDWGNEEDDVDLAAVVNGGRALDCSDTQLGHMDNLLLPGRATKAGDGWQTRRSRADGHRDWVVIALAAPALITSVLVDTNHHKGDFPESCMLEGSFADPAAETDMETHILTWTPILPEVALEGDAEQLFETVNSGAGIITHVRLSIFPDGAISRLRVFGKPVFNGGRYSPPSFHE